MKRYFMKLPAKSRALFNMSRKQPLKAVRYTNIGTSFSKSNQTIKATIYFQGMDGTNSAELLNIDRTTAGRTLVEDINAGKLQLNKQKP